MQVPNTRLVDGKKFTFTQVDVSSKTKKIKVDFDTVRKKSSKLKKGVTKIDTEGVRGVRAVTYEIVRHNGEIVKRVKIKSNCSASRRLRSFWLAPRRRRPRTRALVQARHQAASGTSSPNASPAATGRSIPAMATTGACNSASAPGARTAARACRATPAASGRSR